MTDVPLPGCDHTVAAPPIESSRPMMLDPTPSRPPLRRCPTDRKVVGDHVRPAVSRKCIVKGDGMFTGMVSC